MSCVTIQNIADTECIGASLPKINGNFAALATATCSLSSNTFNSIANVDTKILTVSSNFSCEPLINTQFNHLTNVSTIIAQGVKPVQNRSGSPSFFPDDIVGLPSFKIANNSLVGKHWLTIEFTPQRANLVLGEINFPIRVADYDGGGAEDETNIYIFDVSASTPKIIVQQALFNGTVPSTGGNMRVGFGLNTTPNTLTKLLVTTMCGQQANRNETHVFPSYSGYNMKLTSFTYNAGTSPTQWDSSILSMTNNNNMFANVSVLVNGFYKI